MEYVKGVNNFGEKKAIQTIYSFIAEMSSDGNIGRNIAEDFFITLKTHATDINGKDEKIFGDGLKNKEFYNFPFTPKKKF